jgi:hypothetical protein
MKPAQEIIQLKSSTRRCNDRKQFVLNGGLLWLLAFTGGITAMGGPVDSKEMPPTAQINQIAQWQPGDPMSFSDGLVTFDAQVRERVEVRDNWVDFNSKTNTRDDAGLLERLRLGLKLTPTEWFTFYAQMEDSRTFFDDSNSITTKATAATAGSQRNFTTNDDPVALRQAYLQFNKVFDQPLSFELGRQVLSYGDERLVGAFDWDNNARVFDATRMCYQAADYTVDAFAAYPVPHQTQDFDAPETHDLFGGLYATTSLIPDITSDYYFFWRSKSKVDPVTSFTNEANQSDGDPSPDGDYATLGTRWKSKLGAFSGWDFGYEGAFQVGTVVNPLGGTATKESGQTINTERQDLLAGMSHAEVGYTFKSDWTPRVFTSFDYGSGSDNPNSGTSNTFQNLYPTNHPLYGIMDRFSLQNMYQATVGVIAKPLDNLTVRLDYHNTWLVSTEDEWRYANQTPVGASALSPAGESTGTGGYSTRYVAALSKDPSNYMGSEVDLIATYAVTKWCKLQVGGAHFFAGDYIRETAPTQETDDANFVYSQVQFDF